MTQTSMTQIIVALTADEVSALILQLPPEARRPDAGLVWDNGELTVPAAFAAEATALMARADWRLGPPPTDDEARAECARRINAAAPLTAQLNLNAYVNVLNAKASLSPAEQADLAAFAQAVGWIAAMRATWRTLADAGDVAYRDDAKWPVLPAAAAALAARF